VIKKLFFVLMACCLLFLTSGCKDGEKGKPRLLLNRLRSRPFPGYRENGRPRNFQAEVPKDNLSGECRAAPR